MFKSKLGQRFLGLLLLGIGSWYTAWSWYTVLNDGDSSRLSEDYFFRAVIGSPPLAIAGVGLLICPYDQERLRAEHGVEKPENLSHYPLVWKVVIVVALLAGLGNWLAILHY